MRRPPCTRWTRPDHRAASSNSSVSRCGRGSYWRNGIPSPRRRISSPHEVMASPALSQSETAADDLLHDFAGAAVDAGDPGVGPGPGDRILGHVAVAAVELDAGVDGPALKFGAPVLGHGRLLG